MYPHTHAVIELLQGRHEVVVSGIDDRGLSLYLPFDPAVSRARWLWLSIKRLCTSAFTSLSASLLSKRNFDVVIAIDHTALNIAARYFSSARLILWSHDILAADHPWQTSPLISKVIEENCEAVHQCHAIWIQDPSRGALIDETLHCQHIPKVLLPVALRDDVHASREATRRIQRPQPPCPLSLMHITPSLRRGTCQLIRGLEGLSTPFYLTVQGSPSPEIMACAAKSQVRLRISPLAKRLVNMRMAVAQADIGLVSYEGNHRNEYFVSHASGQVVEFLRLGIPVIVCGANDFAGFGDRSCGLVHCDYQRLPSAIESVLSQYSRHCIAARKLFLETYLLDSPLKAAIDHATAGL